MNEFDQKIISGKVLSSEERHNLVNRLCASWAAMDNFSRASVKHAMGAPKLNPQTGEPFKSFREVIEVSSDHTLLTLASDFEGNGELAAPQEKKHDPI